MLSRGGYYVSRLRCCTVGSVPTVSSRCDGMERNSRVEADFKDCGFVRGALVACGLSTLIWSSLWLLI
jgi:hypothetical protein